MEIDTYYIAQEKPRECECKYFEVPDDLYVLMHTWKGKGKTGEFRWLHSGRFVSDMAQLFLE